MSDWLVPLIAAGAGLAGVAVGGAIQLKLARVQHQQETQRERRVLFKGYLRDLIRLPGRMDEAIRSEDQAAVVKELTEPFFEVRAGLMLEAPALRELANDVAKAIQQWATLAQQRAEANIQQPRESRISVVSIYTDTYEEVVMPAVRKIAAAMAAELDRDA